MKAVTVQPRVAGSVRFEEVPEPDERTRFDPGRSGGGGYLRDRRRDRRRAPTAGRLRGGTG